MATEHAEEVKLTGDIKDAENESCIKSEDLQVKVEEKINTEDSDGSREGGAEESATELEAAIVSEEKVEDVKNEPIVEEVEREGDVKISDPSIGDAIQEEEKSKVDAETSLAGLKQETDSSEKEVKNQVDVTDVPEPSKESTEALLEDSKATTVQESESETAEEFSEVVSPSAVPVIEEENTESAKEETPVTDKVRIEEVSEDVPEVFVSETKEFKDNAGVTAVTKEVHDVPETAEGDQNAVVNAEESVSIYRDPIVENASDPLKPDDKVKEEMQEKAVASEEVSEDVPEAFVSETKDFKDDAGVTAVTEEVRDVPETAEGDQNAVLNAEESVSADRDPIVENVSDPVKPDSKVEGEAQEKAVASEEPTMSIVTNNDDATQVTEISAGSENVEEAREATLEGSVMQEKSVVSEEPTLSDTANVVAPTQVPEISSDVSGGVEKIEENKEAGLESSISQEKAIIAEEPTMSDATKSEATTQVAEVSFKCFDGAEKVEEKKTTLGGLFMQENAVVAEELTMSDTIESDAATQVPEVSADEKKEAILEGLTQEKAIAAEEPTLPHTIKTDGATQVTEISSEDSVVEKVEVHKEANLESSVVGPSRDLDVASEVPQVFPEGVEEEKASEGVEEKKDASLGSAEVPLLETSRDIDADKIVSEKTEKDEKKTSAEPTKEGDEAPKAEVIAKSSHRQSSNLFSKVKHSIVKVKKAIIGKSPSSKAMPAEDKDEIKVQ